MSEAKEAESKEEIEGEEFLTSFFDQAAPPKGQGNSYFQLDWSISLIFIPFLPYFLACIEGNYILWGLHIYSLIIIFFYIGLIHTFKKSMAHISNPFDFVTMELINFFNIIIYFGISFFFLSQISEGSFNKVALSLIDSIYFSFVTVTTLGYGDISPTSFYSKLLIILELCFGLWFVVTVLPVAVAD